MTEQLFYPINYQNINYNDILSSEQNEFFTNCIYLDIYGLSEIYHRICSKTEKFDKYIKNIDTIKLKKNYVLNYNKYNLKFTEKNIDEENLQQKWFDAYNYESQNKNKNQEIILEAWKNGLLDMLDPQMVYDDTLEIIWNTINKYELWIENIDEKYWSKLENYLNREYKYLII